jgi:hypothetical protein
MLALLSRLKSGVNIEVPGIERRFAMYFMKTCRPGYAQQFIEDQGSYTFASIFWSDIQLEDLSSRNVQCAKSHRHRSVLGYDDVSFRNVIFVVRCGSPC